MSKPFFNSSKSKSKSILCITFALVLSILFIGSTNFESSQNTFALNKTLNVVTSVAPITNIVKNIGGDKINLIGLVPEGVNSHTYEPVPSDIVKLGEADLVIINGLYLEDPMERIVNTSLNTNRNIQLLKLGDNTVSPTEWVFDFSFPRDQGHPNPHLWLNPIYAMKFANLTKDKLIEMDPNNSAYYTENADKYVTLLKKLDNGIKEATQSVPPENRKLITYHDSWAYFAPRYNMTVIGAVQPSDFSEPSPLDIAKLIDQIKAENVSAIFASEVFSNRITDQIADESGIEIVQTLSDDALPGNLTAPNHTYVGMMLENMENMIVPLGGNVSSLSDINPANTYAP
ncbi:metal ABC transporter substrate-binding protein [Candidatus Nitrosocosmicus hydrocola]|uniref:metal ABC transporter substrate-binding protein n=1 Tax=Candidatus Nitrosocosmicus hydrocola TaxID=1826872 RepID=UPI0011E5CF25|nr:metal ABC transporter substrate-binding protein [Candidatus Nitrosocosmicus hydrocola]